MPELDPVALAVELIRCRSVTPAEDGVLDLLARVLAPLGFAVTRLDFDGDGSYPVGNLFATRGTGAPHVLFAGHTDVVPAGDEARWTHPPFAGAIAEGKLHGRGAADMKSAIAAFIVAAARLPAGHRGTVSLAITNDEEADAINGTDKLIGWAIAKGHRFDLGIVGEPSSLEHTGDSIKIGRRGSLNGRITVTGAQGHSAYPDRAVNPLPVAAALVTALTGTRLDEGTEHFPPSSLAVTAVETGNAATNVIPGAAAIAYNIRFNDRWTPDALDAWVGDRIAAIDARGTAIAHARIGRPSLAFLSPLGGAVETLIASIAAVTGAPPALATWGGTSDARFLARHCPAIELGVVGPTLHQTDEHVAVADLRALADLYERVIGDFLGV